MHYPTLPDFAHLTERITEFSRLKAETGALGIEPLLREAEAALRQALERLKALPEDEALAAREPNELPAIRRLRPDGPRRLWDALDPAVYRDKLAGALYSRFAGCILGSIVEFWPVDEMERWAKYIGDAFPPVDYWSRVKDENSLRYGKTPRIGYAREQMHGVPVDDDLTYTQLGLLLVEEAGPHFTVEDVGRAWLRYLPYACTAEEVALRNLKAGVPAARAAEVDNPYCQWIGADIRSDPFAYMAPGLPEFAAQMAYHDAFLSHRRNGIYGEMFFAAAQSAAFAVSSAEEALRIGLSEIPAECALAQDIRWALEAAPGVRDYRDARQAVDERFAGMSGVHTNLNACLTVFGLSIGQNDVTKVLSETVAMGMDNDCTAATAGSIVGAIVGYKQVPAHWYRHFDNRCHSYLIGHDAFAIDDLLRRFEAQARRVYAQHAAVTE